MSPQNTSFSAHVSRSAMGRYLRDRLPADQAQQIETHFQHCPQCSTNLTEYIQQEEPENQKAYHKKVKGKLKQESSIKKKLLSPFQVKMFRSGAAVVALLVFSFFAIKTVMNKKITDEAASYGTVAINKPVSEPRPRKLSSVKVKEDAPAESAPPTTKPSATEPSATEPSVANPSATANPKKAAATPLVAQLRQKTKPAPVSSQAKKQPQEVKPVADTAQEQPVTKSAPATAEEAAKAPKKVEPKLVEKVEPLSAPSKLKAIQDPAPAVPVAPLR